MKQPLLCLFLLCYGFNTWAQEKWDLQKCVSYAIANNISVKQADLQSRFSALDLNRNRLSQYPDLNLQTNGGYRFGRSENPTTGVLEDNNFFNSGFQLQTGVTLFNWYSKKYNIESSRLFYEADRAQIKKVQDDVALNVAVGYLQALLAKEQVNITMIQVQQTASQFEVTRKRVAAGALPELHAAELEAQLARDSSTLISAQAQVQQLLLQLKAILNLDAAVPFDIATPPVQMIPVEPLAELQPDAVYAAALKNLPQQKVNELRLQSNQVAVKAARGSMYPTLSAYGGLGSNFVNIQIPQQFEVVPNKPTGATVQVGGTTYSVLAPGLNVTDMGVTPLGKQVRNNFSQNIGLALNVPIFNGGALRTNWERSKLNVLNSELAIESANQTLKQDIYKAYTDAMASMQKFNANRKSVEAAQKAFDFSQKRYNLNLVSTYDLLNSQNNLLRARTEMLYAQFDYVFKMKLLEFYKGQGLKLQ
jgi:outer membrane protein